MSKHNLYLAIVCYLFTSSILYAQGMVRIEPGKYRFIKTTKTNFDLVAATSTTEECITDHFIDPKSVLLSKENCKIQNMKSKNNSVSFDFSCDKTGEKSPLKGHADYSAEGNGISYQFTLKGSFRGKKLIVESSGTGERIGDCVPEHKPNE